MIPKFPEFKKLELSDRADVESFTSKFEPYSDFEFITLISWDVNNIVKISILNGNLVVIHHNLLKDQSVCSFLGNQNVNATVDILLRYIDDVGLSDINQLGVVPEASILGIDLDKFMISIDIAACDYIYDLQKLSQYSDHSLYKKRKRSEMFPKLYSNPSIETLNLTTQSVKDEILLMTKLWSDQKTEIDKDFRRFIELEYQSLRRCLDLFSQDLICIGLLLEGKIVAYNIVSKISDAYGIGLFLKYDKRFTGINEFLMNKSAEVLLGRGCQYVNGQEDLGLEGLRVSKNSYAPTHFLRKYSISRQ